MTETKAPQFVNAEMTIGEAVMRYPVAAQVMLSYGLHCVGCHVSGVETIRQGAMGHGMMDEDEVEELVKEMNDAIAEAEGTKGSSGPLTITKKAADKIAEFAKEEDKQEGLFLRVKVIPGGCSGFSYDLDFDHEPADKDTVVKAGSIDVRVDPDSIDLLDGAVIDYIDGLNGSGFKIDNPNAQSSCGCGKSFA